jgi:hypothetical protein
MLLLLTGPLLGQAAILTWPDAVVQLTRPRVHAELCIGLLKRHGNSSQITSGELAYTKAKADSDAAIAGLITAVATGDTPPSLPVLQAKLSSSVLALDEFCNSVDKIITTTTPPDQKDVWSALAKILGIESLVKAVSDGVATLYNDHRKDAELTKQMIRVQLEAARWPDFSTVPPR